MCKINLQAFGAKTKNNSSCTYDELIKILDEATKNDIKNFDHYEEIFSIRSMNLRMIYNILFSGRESANPVFDSIMLEQICKLPAVSGKLYEILSCCHSYDDFVRLVLSQKGMDFLKAAVKYGLYSGLDAFYQEQDDIDIVRALDDLKDIKAKDFLENFIDEENLGGLNEIEGRTELEKDHAKEKSSAHFAGGSLRRSRKDFPFIFDSDFWEIRDLGNKNAYSDPYARQDPPFQGDYEVLKESSFKIDWATLGPNPKVISDNSNSFYSMTIPITSKVERVNCRCSDDSKSYLLTLLSEDFEHVKTIGISFDFDCRFIFLHRKIIPGSEIYVWNADKTPKIIDFRSFEKIILALTPKIKSDAIQEGIYPTTQFHLDDFALVNGKILSLFPVSQRDKK